MEKASKVFFNELREKALEKFLVSFMGSKEKSKFRAFQGIEALELESYLVKLVKTLILFESGDYLTAKMGQKLLKVPVYTFNEKIRLKAASILNSKLYPQWNDFTFDGRKEIAKEMDKLMKGLVGADDDVLKVDDLPRSIRRWARTELGVRKALRVAP
jgi:hypothetical protein